MLLLLTILIMDSALRLCTWNSRGHGADRLIYINKLLQQCDILLVQETWLHDWELNKLSDDDAISILGVSGMDPQQLLVGRPHGGCAVLFHSSLKISIASVQTNSCRMFACVVNVINSIKFLIFNVYMPCDSVTNVDAYMDIMNEIESIISVHQDIDNVIIGGDMNVDLRRTRSANLRALENLCFNQSLLFCQSFDQCHVDFTYENEATGARSIIDHFCVSENIFNSIVHYLAVHEGDNLSDHAPVFLDIKLNLCNVTQSVSTSQNRVSWHRASSRDILAYKEMLSVCLEGINVPYEALHCVNCSNFNNDCLIHTHSVDKYYDDIVRAMRSSAEVTIPVCKKRGKAGWSTHVKQFQEDAIFWNRIWVENGRPTTGSLSNIRRSTRAQYRRASRWVVRNQDKLSADRMAQALASNNSRDLWGEVKKKANKVRDKPIIVDDADGELEVCEMFKVKYESLYSSVSFNENDMNEFIDQVTDRISTTCAAGSCYHNHFFSVDNVKSAVKMLKSGKSDSECNLSSNNYINGCDSLFVHLSILFNLMFARFSSPNEMLKSFLIPIPKNRKKSLSDSNNFRSIAISSIMGKILDHIVLKVHSNVLSTSDLQFGFKSNHSTTQCTYVLNEVIEYYNSRNTPVYTTLLDASRAFDRVHFIKLFNLLLFRGMCPALIKFLVHMYIRQTLLVRWQNTVSAPFSCRNGIKQGGVLSPILFCVYMDELLMRLKKSKIGCYVGHVYCGALTYADDLTLIAPTHSAMSHLIEICEQFSLEYSVKFNSTKSHVVLFNNSSRIHCCQPFYLHGQPIEYVTNALHLGTLIGKDTHAKNLSKLSKDMIIKTNVLYSHYKHCSPDVLCSLFKSYCTSFYGSPLWSLSNINDFIVCYKKCIKRLLNLNLRTRSKYVYLLMHQPDLDTQLMYRFSSFWNNCFKSDNVLIQLCANLSLTSNSVVAKN
jgi:exonuclease III